MELEKFAQKVKEEFVKIKTKIEELEDRLDALEARTVKPEDDDLLDFEK